jgi:Ca-activated chloride channel family protein
VPLTNDFNVLNTVVSGISVAPRGRDQTAIGNGIAIAVNRLIESPAESRIIILLTDGANNTGQIDPIQAAEIASQFGIKVYTVGIGSHGLVDFPVFDNQGRRVTDFLGRQRYQQVNIEFCIDTVNRIAEIGGTGRARMSTNTQELQAIFDEIDLLEKTEIQANIYYEHREMFIYFLYVALALMFIMIMTRSIFRMTLP